MVDESAAQPTSRPAPPRPAGRRRRIVLIAAGAVALVIGTVALTGGFADVPDEEQPAYGLGETFENSLYSITVTSIDVQDVDPISQAEADTPVIVVRAELLSSDDEPIRLAYNWLRPLDVELDQISGSLVSARDGSIEPPVQPGLPIEVLYVWRTAPGEVSAGDEVQIGVFERYLDATNPIAGATTAPALVGIFEATS